MNSPVQPPPARNWPRRRTAAIAQGASESRPCPRFQRLVSQSEWRDGPLGEKLCSKLTRHVAQCGVCTGVRDKLKDTLELIPAFVLILIPAELAREQTAERDKGEKRHGNGSRSGPKPAARNPAGPTTASKVLSGVRSLLSLIFVVGLVIGGINYLKHHQRGVGPTSQSTLSVWVADRRLTVRSTPAGLRCHHVCHHAFTTGAQLTLTSNYQPGGLPLNWMGCDTATTSAADNCTVTLNHNSAVCLVPYDPAQPNLVSSAECRRRARR